jgi:hypothetical protein
MTNNDACIEFAMLHYYTGSVDSILTSNFMNRLIERQSNL